MGVQANSVPEKEEITATKKQKDKRRKIIIFVMLGVVALGAAAILIWVTSNKPNNESKGTINTSDYNSMGANTNSTALEGNVLPELKVDWSQFDIMRLFDYETSKYNTAEIRLGGISESTKDLQYYIAFPSNRPINQLRSAKTTDLISTRPNEQLKALRGLEQYNIVKTDSLTTLKSNNMDSFQIGTVNGQLMCIYSIDGNIHLSNFYSILVCHTIKGNSELSTFVNDDNTKTVAINVAGRADTHSNNTNVIFFQYVGQKKFGVTTSDEVVYEVAVMDPESSKEEVYLLTDKQMTKYGQYTQGDEKDYPEKLDYENLTLFAGANNERSYDVSALYKYGEKVLAVAKNGMRIETNIKNVILNEANYDGNINPTEKEYNTMFLKPKYNNPNFLMNKPASIDGLSFVYGNDKQVIGYDFVDKELKTRYMVAVDYAIPAFADYQSDSSYIPLEGASLYYQSEYYDFHLKVLAYKPCESSDEFTEYIIEYDSKTYKVCLYNGYTSFCDPVPENDPIFDGVKKKLFGVD